MVDIKKLDLGCGKRTEDHHTRQQGYIGVDLANVEGVDIIHNLNQFPYPFEDNSIDEIYTSHFIEHIPMCFWNEENEYTIVQKDERSIDLMDKFIAECYRILKPLGQLRIIAPYYNSIRCWQDPTHRRAIGDNTFAYYNRDWRIGNGLDHYHANVNFDYVGGYVEEPDMEGRSKEAKTFFYKHYTNTIQDIHATLTKKE